MAIQDFSAAKLISSSITTKNLRQSGDDFYDREETVEEKVEKIYAISETDVNDTITNNAQPAAVSGSSVAYSYDSQLVNEETNVYNMTRTYTKKTIAFAT